MSETQTGTDCTYTHTSPTSVCVLIEQFPVQCATTPQLLSGNEARNDSSITSVYADIPSSAPTCVRRRVCMCLRVRAFTGNTASPLQQTVSPISISLSPRRHTPTAFFSRAYLEIGQKTHNDSQKESHLYTPWNFFHMKVNISMRSMRKQFLFILPNWIYPACLMGRETLVMNEINMKQ